jgi:segregation and condensation protein A
MGELQDATEGCPLSTTYSVRLPVFEGPLDLLLHLIEERELDITKVSLAAVTDQYLDYIANLSDPDPAKVADFLVIAAKLLLIKSRVLLPQPPPQLEPEEEDVGDELVRRLIEYRRFKNAAQQLRSREEDGLRAYPRLVPTDQPEGVVRLESITLDALLDAVRLAMATKKTSSADDVVTPLRISLPEKIALLERLLADKGRFSFNQVLADALSRSEVVVAFLALLQLIKRRKVRVEQQRLFGDIVVSSAE